ncbi:MAG: helical backbone metal receptor [Gillisia sp.]|nr:helical backbone metal receptor [Gillisia sp.]
MIKDQLQREINIKDVPKRIISLVPSQTELLVSLGLEKNIVGITKFCIHPKYLRKSKTVVGGTKKVHFDKIRALNPDIILCNKEENTLEMVLELEKIAPVHVSEIIDFEDVLILIEMYGKLFDRSQEANQLNLKLQKEKREFEKEIPVVPCKVAYFIWREPWMVASGDTFINSLLKLNGWENVFENKESRYPEIKPEELKRLKPDLILLSSEPYPFKEKHVEEMRQICNVRVELVDGEYFSWYGSRLIPAFDYFKKLQILLSGFL